jgi:hypothetical protein
MAAAVMATREVVSVASKDCEGESKVERLTSQDGGASGESNHFEILGTRVEVNELKDVILVVRAALSARDSK